MQPVLLAVERIAVRTDNTANTRREISQVGGGSKILCSTYPDRSEAPNLKMLALRPYEGLMVLPGPRTYQLTMYLLKAFLAMFGSHMAPRHRSTPARDLALPDLPIERVEDALYVQTALEGDDLPLRRVAQCLRRGA